MTKTMNIGAAAVTVAALTLSVFAALPASAFACENWCGGGSDTTTNNSVAIAVSNEGAIISVTTASSNTGDNWAGGSYGGDAGKGGSGGDGGEAYSGDERDCDCSPDVGNAYAGDAGNGGNGGNGGNAGAGGLVVSGDAESNSGSMNVLNTTEVEVEAADCGCDNNTHHFSGWGRGDRETDNSVTVEVGNTGAIISATDAKTDTGYNGADGSFGGEGARGGRGGEGGTAAAGGGYVDYDWHAIGGNAEGGNGGDGGEGGEGGEGDVGGTVRTGRSETNSGSINLMNSVIVRVTR